MFDTKKDLLKVEKHLINAVFKYDFIPGSF